MTTTTTSVTTNTFPFDDTFHELDDDLDTEANDWPYLNIFYLNFENEIQKDEKLNQPNAHQYFHGIPDYLSASNSEFRARFFPELRNISNPIDFQDLQELAVLTHQASIIHLHEQLWHSFLQIGKGQFKQPLEKQLLLQNHPDLTMTLSFWPKIVTAAMISKGILPQNNRQQQDQNLYINFVQNYLDEIKKQTSQRQLQFDAIINRLSCYGKSTLSNNIEDYLRKEESLIAMRRHFQRRIALLGYVSIDRSYQLAYFQQKPTHLQVQIANQLCSLTYTKEQTEEELILYKFDFLYQNFPKSFDILEMSPPTLLTTLSDPVIRQRLSNQYQTIIQRTKDDFLNLYKQASRAKRDDAQNKFDKEIADMWKNQRQQPVHERLTPTMLTIIEQRQKNIIECVKWIYQLKGDFYLKVPPRPQPIIH